MLIIPRKTEDTMVIHAVLGDESHFFMDIHGGIVLPISSMVERAAAEGCSKVILMLTRCDSERDVAEFMDEGSNMMPTGPDGKPMPLDKVPRCEYPSQMQTNAFQPPITPSAAKPSKCSYCGAHKDLLPLVGLKICSECALIELKNKQATKLKELVTEEE